MEPKFQTSFIPKKPIVSTQSVSASVIPTTNIFSLAASVIFVVTILVSGGIFAYQKVLNNQIVTLDTQIDEARAAFQIDKIQELINANSRLTSANGLLDRHIAVSKLLALLRDITVKKIRFSEFIYKNTGDAPTIGMKVEAQSYNALAFQGEQFSKNEFIKNPSFFDFSPTENGNVTASFFSSFDSSLISYKKAIESVSTNQ